MSFLTMLGNSFKAVPTTETETKRTRTTTPKNPVNADLRVFANGDVYPSQSLVNEFNLQFSKDKTGNGFDVIDSRQFPNTAGNDTPFIMIAPVARTEGKVDLFGKGKFKDGEPETNVMTYGGGGYGTTLVKMLKEVYGTDIVGYVDLNIEQVEEIKNGLQQATNGVYNVPKTVARGADKGLPTYVRRENLDIYVLVPLALNNNDANVSQESPEVIQTTPQDVEI